MHTNKKTSPPCWACKIRRKIMTAEQLEKAIQLAEELLDEELKTLDWQRTKLEKCMETVHALSDRVNKLKKQLSDQAEDS